MKKFLAQLILVLLVYSTSYAQKTTKPTKIGLVKEFTGVVLSSYMYDGDYYFTIKDANSYKVNFYFNAGSCHNLEDPYSINTDITNLLREKIDNTSADSKNKLKVKVIAKSTYGEFCGNCDECEDKKEIIWRPVKVTEIK